MQVVIVDDTAQVGVLAATRVSRLVRRKPTATLGLATGSSPLGIYAELQRQVEHEGLDCTSLHAFALDEYVGLPPAHPASYHTVIEAEVVAPLRLKPTNVHVPNGAAVDLEAACTHYEQMIAEQGGVDLQILGIGVNGHIGFNEPTSSFGSRTRIKTLTPQTREDNARFFDPDQEVPTHCMTVGLGTILEAREIVLVAHGPAKATAVARAVEGPLTSMCPATALQLHPKASIVLDRAAASRLAMRDYYTYTVDNLPASQRWLDELTASTHRSRTTPA